MIKTFFRSVHKKARAIKPFYKEFYLKNILLYPLFFFIIQSPVILTQHCLFLFLHLLIVMLSLSLALFFFKRRLIFQIVPSFTFKFYSLISAITYLAFIFNSFDMYVISFICYASLSIIVLFNGMLIFVGKSAKFCKHYLITGNGDYFYDVQYFNGSTIYSLKVLLDKEYILVNTLSFIKKEFQVTYIPSLDLYMKMDRLPKAGFDTYLFSNDESFKDIFDIESLSEYLESLGMDINTISKEDIEVFLMMKY